MGGECAYTKGCRGAQDIVGCESSRQLQSLWRAWGQARTWAGVQPRRQVPHTRRAPSGARSGVPDLWVGAWGTIALACMCQTWCGRTASAPRPRSPVQPRCPEACGHGRVCPAKAHLGCEGGPISANIGHTAGPRAHDLIHRPGPMHLQGAGAPRTTPWTKFQPLGTTRGLANGPRSRGGQAGPIQVPARLPLPSLRRIVPARRRRGRWAAHTSARAVLVAPTHARVRNGRCRAPKNALKIQTNARSRKNAIRPSIFICCD